MKGFKSSFSTRFSKKNKAKASDVQIQVASNPFDSSEDADRPNDVQEVAATKNPSEAEDSVQNGSQQEKIKIKKSWSFFGKNKKNKLIIADLYSQISDLNDKHEAAMKSLEATIAGMEGTMNAKEKEHRDELRAVLEEKKAKIAEMEDTLVAMKERYEYDLHVSNEKNKLQVDELQHALDEMKKKLETMVQEHEEARQTLVSKVIELQKKQEDDHQAHDKEKQHLVIQMSEAKETISELEKKHHDDLEALSAAAASTTNVKGKKVRFADVELTPSDMKQQPKHGVEESPGKSNNNIWTKIQQKLGHA